LIGREECPRPRLSNRKLSAVYELSSDEFAEQPPQLFPLRGVERPQQL